MENIVLKLRALVNAKNSLEKLSRQDIDIVQSFKLSKILREVNEHYADYDKQRIELIKKYGSEDKENPGSFQVKNENIDIFNKEIGKLLDIEIKLNFPKLSLLNFNGIKISPADAINLEEFFEV